MIPALADDKMIKDLYFYVTGTGQSVRTRDSIASGHRRMCNVFITVCQASPASRKCNGPRTMCAEKEASLERYCQYLAKKDHPLTGTQIISLA